MHGKDNFAKVSKNSDTNFRINLLSYQSNGDNYVWRLGWLLER